MALVTLSRDQLENTNILEMRAFSGGEESVEPKDKHFQLTEMLVFLKGDYGSQVEQNHTSIHWSEFQKWVRKTQGTVVFLVGRVVFEREVMFAFDNDNDAAYFRLTFDS